MNVAALALVCIVSSAVFAAEEKKEQPRTDTRSLGGIEVTALLERLGQGKKELLIGANHADWERSELPGAMDNSINAFLVRMNGKTILFDTGLPVKGNGGILAALAEAGVKPESIDAIVITHFHMDHVGGLLNEGKAVYPKAELLVPKMEVDKWFDPGTEFLTVYAARTNAFDWGEEILPGVVAQEASGHTAGHTVFRLEADGGKLLVIGDLIHFPGVQLANPDVAVTYDKDPAVAIQARKRIFRQAADEGITVASMHMRFPGMGVLKANGAGYTFSDK